MRESIRNVLFGDSRLTFVEKIKRAETYFAPPKLVRAFVIAAALVAAGVTAFADRGGIRGRLGGLLALLLIVSMATVRVMILRRSSRGEHPEG